MELGCWVYYWGQDARIEENAFTKVLTSYGIKPEPLNQNTPIGAGVCVFSEVSSKLCDFLQHISRESREQMIAVANPAELLNGSFGWDILQAGAEERFAPEIEHTVWSDLHFERVIQRAVLFGVGLKDIGRVAEDVAIRIATEEEGGNIQRAARRLGVTDRALQLRRASKRQNEEDELHKNG